MRMNKSLVLILLIFTTLSISCAGKHPSDVAASFIVPGTEKYFQVQQKLLDAYDAGIPLVVDNWAKIDAICDSADTQYKRIWRAWRTVSAFRTNASEAELAAQIGELLKFIPQLEEYLK